jgi:hypothetical protein
MTTAQPSAPPVGSRRPALAPQAVIGVVALPWRMTRGAADVARSLAALSHPHGPIRRPGGYADRLMVVIGENGLLEQLTRVITDPHGPVRIANLVGDLTSPDRPIGRLLAADGRLDQLLDARRDRCCARAASSSSSSDRADPSTNWSGWAARSSPSTRSWTASPS